MKHKEVLGIDIGGSGIKGMLVNAKNGTLLSERHRILTPSPATPEAVAREVGNLVKHFDWKGPIGCGFPAVIQNGIAKTASNIDDSWIGTNAASLFSEATNCPVLVLNDADAAGMAEMKFGAGHKQKGVVLLVTVGSGIGTVVFTKGKLLPNMEWGHVYMQHGLTGEQYASDAVRKNEELDWDAWGKRFNEYLVYMEKLLWPDLIIIGGGASKKLDKFKNNFTVQTEIKSAQLLNEAGIIGAAYAARKAIKKE